VLYQLSYSPGLRGTNGTAARGTSSRALTLAAVHRRALGLLFAALTAGLWAIALFSALEGGRAWVIALASAALGTWMGGLSIRALRRN
jgi:hypothetical protein